MHNTRMIVLFLILIASSPVQSGENEIQIPTNDRDTIEAIILSLDENNKLPAIVYMHGGAMRERGNPDYGPNNEFLYDITYEIRDMNSLGFVVLAPLRKTPAGYCNGDDAVKESMKITRIAMTYLKSQQNVNKICLIGFSEGALISMWAMAVPNDYTKAIIMSPPNQCRMRLAGSEKICGRHLRDSGKLEKINKKIIIKLGDAESKGTIDAAKGFAKKLLKNIVALDGDHRSFTVPPTRCKQNNRRDVFINLCNDLAALGRPWKNLYRE